MKTLKYWLDRSTDSIFADFYNYVSDFDDQKRRRIFIDRGADILFVAHVDTVCKPGLVKTTRNRIYGRGLDDRLGCHIAYRLSEKLGADLLLTDNEEICQSTAKYHTCKDYKWIVEFDRAGSDVVTYDCDNKDFIMAVTEYWPLGMGSYSDICDLKTTACCMNIGIGYELAHSMDSYSVRATTAKQIELFERFFIQYKDTEFGERDVWLTAGSPACEVCGYPDGQEIYGYVICRDCVEALLMQRL